MPESLDDKEFDEVTVRGLAEFFSGLDAGPIELPEDGGTVQLADMPITDALTAGDVMAYVLALDAQNIIEVNAEADGAGGIQAAWAKHPERHKPTRTANATVSEACQFVGVDTSGGTVTITLDTGIVENGVWVVIKDEAGSAGTNAITVDTAGSATIDGNTSVSIANNYGGISLYTDGTNWFQFGATSGGGTL